jgi:hypothetical protein
VPQGQYLKFLHVWNLHGVPHPSRTGAPSFALLRRVGRGISGRTKCSLGRTKWSFNASDWRRILQEVLPLLCQRQLLSRYKPLQFGSFLEGRHGR